jgi:long-chain acyl-CoA synthetase
VQADLREIGPRVMFSPPRIWETMLSQIQVRAADAGWLKRAAFGWGLRIGKRAAAARVRGHRSGAALRLQQAVAQVVALRPVREQLGLTRIRQAYTGGAPLGPDVFEFFHAIGVNLKQIYGQTEICGIAVMHRDDDVKFNTVGVGIPGTEVRVADDGEILLRSPATMRGYHERPDETAAAFADGWFHTGDVGRLDEDGFLEITGRKKDMIISGGLNVYPREAEEVLYRIDAIAEAAVVGVPDEKWGEVAVAVVVPDPEGFEEEALLEACRERLASYKCPRVVLVHEDPLPRNPSGKVLKRELRPWAADQIQSPEVPSA